LKIQLALDRLTKEECFHLVDETSNFIDLIEIGTGVIKEYGMFIIKEMKERYDQLPILADMKTCDDGKNEAIQAFRSGADVMTVMAFSANQTIVDALSIAQQYDKRIMIDLLGIQNSDRVEQLVSLGCDLFCLHIGKDIQKQEELDVKSLIQLVERFDTIEVAIAGGINAKIAKEIQRFPIDILVVGSAITSSDNPMLASKEMVEQLL